MKNIISNNFARFATSEYSEILTPEAISFVYELSKKFEPHRKIILDRRIKRQSLIKKGQLPSFLKHTQDIRNSEWEVAPIPKDLTDRRVEITGPVNRKMIINALNSGANVFMADFEDSHAPTWQGTIQGQINLRDAVNKTIKYINPSNQKTYQLNDKTATLMVRPRGWHLIEKNYLVDDEPISASLFDFGLFFFHNAPTLLKSGTGPYFYLPKLESHLEARLWNDIFVFSQESLGIPQGSIRATVLLENILASFEMDEILFELQDHSAGLNCGRWDYIFSAIRHFQHFPEFIMPDRSAITMETDFMETYSLMVIETCHKRGIHAMGGMAAQIPIKNDPSANNSALEKVRQDKIREVKNGHDGTWVAHPGLVPLAKEIFDEYMPTPNQIDKKLNLDFSAEDLLPYASGEITKHGFTNNIEIALRYIEAWLGGNGCVPIYNLMEDAATAEISRAQLWQWINNPNITFGDGDAISSDLYQSSSLEVLEEIQTSLGEPTFSESKYLTAKEILDSLVLSQNFVDFLTIPAYEYLD